MKSTPNSNGSLELEMQKLMNQFNVFSSGPAKTAPSSSSQTTTKAPPVKQPAKPKIISDYGGYIPRFVSNYWAFLTQDKKASGSYAHLPTRNGGGFSSCSAEIFTNMGGVCLWTRERREEFVLQIFNLYHNRKTIYFLPTTAQMKNKDNEASVLNLLFELGAVEVYAAPNNQPGHRATNLMHMCVLNCGTDEFRERCLKYICQVQLKNRYGQMVHVILPRFVLEENPELKEVPLVMKGKDNPTILFPSAPNIGKPLATPLRDRLGRFISKTKVAV